jgi:hypothetical protein
MIIFSAGRHVILCWNLFKTRMKEAAVHTRWYGSTNLAKTHKSKKEATRPDVNIRRSSLH